MKIVRLLLLAVIILLPMTLLLSQRDIPAEIGTARQALQGAHNDLEHAGGEWGGHRALAMRHIEEAQKELDLAVAWAREHHDVR
jgi:hypothetical protein